MLTEAQFKEALEELETTKGMAYGMWEMLEGHHDRGYYRGVEYGLDYALHIINRFLEDQDDE